MPTLHDSISRVIEKVEESSGLSTVTVSHITRFLQILVLVIWRIQTR